MLESKMPAGLHACHDPSGAHVARTAADFSLELGHEEQGVLRQCIIPSTGTALLRPAIMTFTQKLLRPKLTPAGASLLGAARRDNRIAYASSAQHRGTRNAHTEEHCIPGRLRTTSGTSSDLSASPNSTQNHRQLRGAWEGCTATHGEQQVHPQAALSNPGLKSTGPEGHGHSFLMGHQAHQGLLITNASSLRLHSQQPRSDGVVSGTSKSSWKMCTIF